MGNLQNRDRVESAGRWRIFIIALAICGLTVSLATRTFRLTTSHGVTVKSGDAQAKRQHMDRDGVHWVPPVPVLTALKAPSPAGYPYLAAAGPRFATVLFDQSLSNRPPPSC